MKRPKAMTRFGKQAEEPGDPLDPLFDELRKESVRLEKLVGPADEILKNAIERIRRTAPGIGAWARISVPAKPQAVMWCVGVVPMNDGWDLAVRREDQDIRTARRLLEAEVAVRVAAASQIDMVVRALSDEVRRICESIEALTARPA